MTPETLAEQIVADFFPPPGFARSFTPEGRETAKARLLELLRALPSPAVRVKPKLFEAEHPYYCERSNYWEGGDNHHKYASAADFLEQFGGSDTDLNLVVRWDWSEPGGSDAEGWIRTFRIWWVMQRKGRFMSSEFPVTEDDEPALREWLEGRWAKLVELWAPIPDNEARVLALLEPVPQQGTSRPEPLCPKCSKPLQRVTRSANSMLNEEQFDAVRAGDWFCDCHTNGRGNTAYAYFWQRELSAKPAPQSDKPAQGVSREVLVNLVEGTREMIDSFGHFLDHYRGQPIPDVFKAWDEARKHCSLGAARAELERNGPAPDGSDEWIAVSERMPTEADGDCYRSVWWHIPKRDQFDQTPIRLAWDMGWRMAPNPPTHWCRTGLRRPAAPKGVTP